jgi:hypothetical protein
MPPEFELRPELSVGMVSVQLSGQYPPNPATARAESFDKQFLAPISFLRVNCSIGLDTINEDQVVTVLEK